MWKHLFFKVGHFCWSLIPELEGNIHHHIHSFIHQTMKGGEGLRHALQTRRKTDSQMSKACSSSCRRAECWLSVSHLTNLYVCLIWRSPKTLHWPKCSKNMKNYLNSADKTRQKLLQKLDAGVLSYGTLWSGRLFSQFNSLKHYRGKILQVSPRNVLK